MQAKVFDPFSERAVNEWLATIPVKVIHSASVVDTAQDGNARQIALVFYEHEQALGNPRGGDAVTARTPLANLLDASRGDLVGA